MAGKIVASTINDDTGVLATQNGMTGIAKAWVIFQGSATPTINNSFNVSSITHSSTGLFAINFTTAMPNANYVISGATSMATSDSQNIVIGYNETTLSTASTASIIVKAAAAGQQNRSANGVAIFA